MEPNITKHKFISIKIFSVHCKPISFKRKPIIKKEGEQYFCFSKTYQIFCHVKCQTQLLKSPIIFFFRTNKISKKISEVLKQHWKEGKTKDFTGADAQVWCTGNDIELQIYNYNLRIQVSTTV